MILAVEKARLPERNPSISSISHELTTDKSSDGLIARMIEPCGADPTVMCSSPVQPWIFAEVAISAAVIALTWSRWLCLEMQAMIAIALYLLVQIVPFSLLFKCQLTSKGKRTSLS